MNREFDFLYHYLEKEKLSVDISEFQLQIQNHPDYPTLLSISDTLRFFNIENGVFLIGLSEIELLPNYFIAILKDEFGGSKFYFIEKKAEDYIYYKATKKIKIKKNELKSRWHGMVILLESEETQDLKVKNQNWYTFFSLLSFILFVVIVEYISILFLNTSFIKISYESLLIIGFIFSLGIIICNKLFIEQKELKEFQLKNSNFTESYDIFKANLRSSTQIEDNLPASTAIILGNKDASLKITILINPFSAYCAEAYKVMQEILQKYFNLVCCEIRFNFNSSDYGNKKSKKIHQQLVALYQEKGQQAFIKGLHNWFKEHDQNKLYTEQISQLQELNINKILSAQFQSNAENDLIFTPEIIINGYVFPKANKLKDLIHFIPELHQDQDFQA